MLKLLRSLLALGGLALIIAFAVANRQPVQINFFPLPFEAVTIPVYTVLLAGLLIGAVLGGVSHWFSTYWQRADLRRLRRLIREREIEDRTEQMMAEKEVHSNGPGR